MHSDTLIEYMATETLQKIFKTFADPTRIRLLALLEREELAVQELMEVMGMAQSRISRHLRILKEAELLTDRHEGTFVLYRMAAPLEGPWQKSWQLVKQELTEDATLQRDADALTRVLHSRAARTRAWFDSIGPEWDSLRKIFNDDLLRARAIAQLVPRNLTVLEVGTGTGVLGAELAHLGLKVIAVDHSEAMLRAARIKLEELGLSERVELREGEANALPLDDGEVDAALAHMVLHYIPVPGEAIREMARALRSGGRIVIVDFEKHDRQWMQQELGVRWLGFEPAQLTEWLEDAGFTEVAIDIAPPLAGGRDLPAALIATARKNA